MLSIHIMYWAYHDVNTSTWDRIPGEEITNYLSVYNNIHMHQYVSEKKTIHSNSEKFKINSDLPGCCYYKHTRLF